MKLSTLQRWAAVTIAEIVLSLLLIAFAPIFLNSSQPLIGFLMWASVPFLLGGSALYVVIRLVDARKARKLFISRFPEYRYLSIKDFLEISTAAVAQSLEMLDVARSDLDFQALHISPLDLLHSLKQQ
jgi:hypothetical protein